MTEFVCHVSELGIFRRAIGGDDVPKCCLRRRGLGIECGKIEIAEISGDMRDTALAIPAPSGFPVGCGEVLFGEIRPGDVMAPVIGRQIDAVGLVICGDDDAATIEHAVLAQVLLVDAQHVRRRRGDCFHVIIPGVAINLAEIAGFVDAQHYGFEETVEPSEHVRRHHLDEIPRPDRLLDRLEQSVLADALPAAEHQSVVDLLSRPLHAMSKTCDDVLGIVGINPMHMLEPRIRFGGIAGNDGRRQINVQAGFTWPMDPAAV